MGCPTQMMSAFVIPLEAARAATLVPYKPAIPESVSPGCTTCSSCCTASAGACGVANSAVVISMLASAWLTRVLDIMLVIAALCEISCPPKRGDDDRIWHPL